MVIDVTSNTAVSGNIYLSSRESTPGVVQEKAIPSVSECLNLLTDTFRADEALIRHSIKVAQTALLLGQTLKRRGFELDLKLIEAAALLHDMARCMPDHASVAAEFLRSLRYPEVAEVVEAHMRTSAINTDSITEIDVVSFSDRLVLKDKLVNLKVRFTRQLINHALSPDATAVIQYRFDVARDAQAAIERAIGMNLDKLFPELSE